MKKKKNRQRYNQTDKVKNNEAKETNRQTRKQTKNKQTKKQANKN